MPPKSQLELKKMPVTAFSKYLDCPFRFYLQYILGMEAISDEKGELDALDFGSLVHYALQKMSDFSGINQCTDSKKLTRFLYARADEWIADRFGPSHPLQVEIQLDAAKQRLAAAARTQTILAREGWEIVKYEEKVEANLYGMLIRGQIDRIDRHRETGQIRILDYKTSDKASNPSEVHIQPLIPGIPEYARVSVNGKERRWLDLQLPLYLMLLSDKDTTGEPIELGYFNLPKATYDTGVAIWQEFDHGLLEAARRCTMGIISNIQNLIFWPPSPKATYDSFEDLFHTDIADCIDLENFKPFMEKK
jgi:ATP-dependent helicase/nuclease subunit B